MSKEIVWASNAMINPAMLRPITHCFDDGLLGEKTKFAIESRTANDAGRSLSAEHFPSEIYVAKHANTNYEQLPDLFFAGSYWVVSGEAADVLLQFNLGGGGLYPTKVFRKDRKTPIGDRWYCLNFGNVKNAFKREGSKDVSRFGLATVDEWSAPNILKDGQLVVTADALVGPDIWVDPKIKSLFFLSDALAQALKEAGVAKPFGLKKCRIV